MPWSVKRTPFRVLARAVALSFLPAYRRLSEAYTKLSTAFIDETRELAAIRELLARTQQELANIRERHDAADLNPSGINDAVIVTSSDGTATLPGADPGANGCSSMTREDISRSILKRYELGLGIGPSRNPIAPRMLGYQIDILDHAGTAEIRSEYTNEATVDCTLIEEVEFVWSGKSLSEAVGKKGMYDCIIASQVIELTPDLVEFLTGCGSLLKDNGRLILAVPDMRRCFGYLPSAHESYRIRPQAERIP